MSDGPLSPEEVAHRGFPTTFRGFDTNEVRAYLQRLANELRTSVSRERELHRRLAEAEHRAAHPVIDNDTLTRALGEEMARILASAQQAASELKARAEENAARILREAHDQAQRIRAQAESLLAERSEEAEAEAAEIRRAAATEAAGVLEQARREAAGAMTDVEAKARQLVQEAQTARSRIIGDLTRRRRAMITQVEQLRAGRERLLEAYRAVRRTTDEVADELQRVEAEAREAATSAAERVAVEPEPAEDLDDVLTAFHDEPQAEVVGPAPSDEQLEAEAGSPAGAAAIPQGVPVAPPVEMEPVLPAPTGGTEPDAPVPSEVASRETVSPVAADRPDAVGERRSSSLRLLRRARVDGPPGQPEGAEGPDEGEAVRVLTPPPEAVETSPPPGGADAPGVDELFARIRAGRAEAVAKAHDVLSAGPDADVSGPGEATGAAPADEPRFPAEAEDEDEEGLLQRRDRAVEGIQARLARKLKRALQDEQNEVLDRLRSSPGGAAAAAALPPAENQARRYGEAAKELVVAAAAAGADFVSPGKDVRPDVADLVGDVASSLAEPLRRGLDRVLGGEPGADQAALVERIGAAYRECKAQRIEGVSGDAVTAAFSRGALAGLAAGTSVRWVVDDDGRPCPDCDDNALAGPTPPGEVFPTGQTHPPAHAGCRCLLAAAEVPAAAHNPG